MTGRQGRRRKQLLGDLGKREDTGNRKSKLYIARCGELTLEEGMDLLSEYGMDQQQQGISQPSFFRFHGYCSVHLFVCRTTFRLLFERYSYF